MTADTPPAAEAPQGDSMIPMWVVQLVGRLTLENELLRGQTPPAPAPAVSPPAVPTTTEG